jgi:hypothetical protein
MTALRRLPALFLCLVLAGCPAGAGQDDLRTDILWFLPPGDGRVPVALLLEDSDGSPLPGRHPWTGWLLEQGIAVAQIRSAAVRGRGDWRRAGCGLRYAADARDALEEAGRNQPRIDTARFAILGAGRGGTEALNSASYFGPQADPATAVPTAVFAFYPGCDGWCPVDYPADGPTRVHIFYGRQDPRGAHRGTADRCRAQAGGRIAFHALEAGHGFDRAGADVSVIDTIILPSRPDPVATAIARAIVWETLALAWQIGD